MFSSQITSTHPPTSFQLMPSGLWGPWDSCPFVLLQTAGALFQDEPWVRHWLGWPRESRLYWQTKSIRGVTPPAAATKRGRPVPLYGQGWAWAVAVVARG